MSRLRAGGREARTLGWRPWWCSPPVPPTSPRTPPPRTAHGSSASSLHIPTLKPQLGSNLGFLSNFSMWLVSVGALWCNCGASIVQAHSIDREVVNLMRVIMRTATQKNSWRNKCERTKLQVFIWSLQCFIFPIPRKDFTHPMHRGCPN